jgi:heterodisulfide reductase subunit B
MAAESNNMFEDLFEQMEKQTGATCSAIIKIFESADSINQSNFKIVNKIIEISEEIKNTIVDLTDSAILDATETLTKVIQSSSTNETDLIREVDSKSSKIFDVDSKILELFQKQQLLIKESNEILTDKLNKLLNEISEIREHTLRRSNSFDNLKDLLPKPEVKTNRRNKKPITPKNERREIENSKRKII